MDSNDEYCKKVLIALATIQMKKQTGVQLTEKDRRAERLITTIGKTLERYDESLKIEDVIENRKEKEETSSDEEYINIFDPPPSYNSTHNYQSSRVNTVDVESDISDDEEGDTLVENWTVHIHESLESTPLKWYTCEFDDLTEPAFEDSNDTVTSLPLITCGNQLACQS